MIKHLKERNAKLELISATMKGNLDHARRLAQAGEWPYNRTCKTAVTNYRKQTVSFDGNMYSFAEWRTVYPTISHLYAFIHVRIISSSDEIGKEYYLDNPALIIELPDNGRD